MKIEEKDLIYLSKIHCDILGPAVKYQNHIFRIVVNSKRKDVESFLQSDFYKELIRQNLIIPVEICKNYEYDSQYFLLESKYVPYVSLPDTWSFNMLKDAALVAIRIFYLCHKYGYNIADGHPYNVLFDYSTPLWCDIGSFFRKSVPKEPLNGLSEFLQSFFRPLLLWSQRNDYLANLILKDYNRNRLLFIERKWFLPLILQFFFSLSLLMARVSIRRWKKSFLNVDCPVILYLMWKVKHMKRPGKKTYWSKYQDSFFQQSDENIKRFSSLKELILQNAPDIKDAIDLAGNQGEFIKYLINQNVIAKGLSVDYDEVAVDILYQNLKLEKKQILPIRQNVIDETGKEPYNQADLSIAMALTHHLILTQKVPIDFIFDEISKTSKKYVLIEFMPLGLWNGQTAPPVPSWYTEKWFEEKFKGKFVLIIKQQVEENRIVFFGRKKDGVFQA